MSPAYDAVPTQSSETLLPATESRPHRSRTLRLGSWGTWILLLGIPLQFAILAFLIYLWTSQEDIKDNRISTSALWRRLALEGWILQAVTVSTAVMRVMLGLHTVLATSITAGIMLEKGSTPWNELCKVSLLRVSNNGPWPLLRLRIQRPRAIPSTVLLSVIFSTSIVLQFTSTLLVSDFHRTSIPMDPQAMNISVVDYYGAYTGMTATEPWSKSPAFFPTFAEAGPIDRIPSTTQFPLMDTGTIKRGLLPFPSERRQVLRSYTGPAVVLSSRVGCVPVEMDVQLTPDIDFAAGATPGPVDDGPDGVWRSRHTFVMRTYLNGSASWNYTKPNGEPYNYLKKDETTNMTYSCDDHTCHRAPLYCPLPGDTRRIGNILGAMDEARLVFCFFEEQSTDKFLFLQVPISADNWTVTFARQFRDPEDAASISLHKASNDAPTPWSAYTAPALGGLNILATICSVAPDWDLQQVAMQTPVDIRESSITWSPENNTWNTEGVLRLFGSTSLDPVERSILTLNLSSPQPPGSAKIDIDTFAIMFSYIQRAFNGETSIGNFSFNSTMHFCGSCIDRVNIIAEAIHPTYNILLQSVLNSTGDPARSLDALFTALWLGMYENSMAGFDLGDMAVTVSSTVVQVPGRWTGLIIVACLVSSAYSCTIALAVMYLRGTRYTMLGNSWYAVAQLQSQELMPVLRSASTLQDSELEVVKDDHETRHSEAMLVGRDGQPELKWIRHRGGWHSSPKAAKSHRSL
ncbi:hypothetical protein CONLIGDRAFT_83859 [Coniochaeta ligniaria NRRL 30616]|uniref:Uncharacterized protein n=1 Tax=Coniochaeta ligniaria NRRL 30616 TaxID=1408157 RepID=A0A1J7ICL6_9PEZI|nr:hypothetical protein CONLIGDRAFT_83859 [Coniochaeta ligniaria NRRL 30616]